MQAERDRASREAAVLVWLLIWALLCGSLGCSGKPEPRGEPSARLQNVVLIIMDAFRADHLRQGSDGVPLTPRLCEFASESWLFTNAISQAAWTKPAVASLFTSLYPDVHDCLFGLDTEVIGHEEKTVADVLPDSFETIAEFLKKVGYQTAAIQTCANVKARFGVAQGFDWYHFVTPEPTANRLTDMAIALVDSLRSPFFCYIHYLDAHGPYDPPDRYLSVSQDVPPLSESDRELLSNYTSYYLDRVLHDAGLSAKRAWSSLSEQGRNYVRRLYDGEVRFVDEEVGRLLAHIETAFPESVIVVTADHGEELWDHGSLGHGKTVYQEVIHVPLVIKFPGATARRFDGAVETIDILPTIASWLHLPPNPDWQGMDLLNVTGSGAEKKRAVYSEARTALRHSNLHWQSIMLGSEKLVVERTSGAVALYDLNLDQAEQTDISLARPESVKMLQALLDERTMRNRHHPAATPSQKVTLDEDTRRQLRALGYLGGGKK